MLYQHFPLPLVANLGDIGHEKYIDHTQLKVKDVTPLALKRVGIQNRSNGYQQLFSGHTLLFVSDSYGYSLSDVHFTEYFLFDQQVSPLNTPAQAHALYRAYGTSGSGGCDVSY